MLKRTLRPDAKGRIGLGRLANGVSSFLVTQESGRIILEPYAEIPAREKWLFDNKLALNNVKQGIKDAAEGKLNFIGSFAQYIDDDIDE